MNLGSGNCGGMESVVMCTSPLGLGTVGTVFYGDISFSSAALGGSIFWFFSFLLQCTQYRGIVGDAGKDDGEWQGLN